MNFERRITNTIKAWPIFWIAGIDQFVFFIFFGVEFILLTLHSRIIITMPAKFFIALWILSLPSALVTDNVLVYTKISLTFLFISIAFIVIKSRLKSGISEDTFRKIFLWMSLYIAIGSALYILNIYRSSFTTAIGLVIGNTESFFLNSISTHGFGEIVSDGNSTFGFRIYSLFSSYSTLSLASLALLPVCLAAYKQRALKINSYLFLALLIVLSIIYTDSRLSIIIALLSILLMLVLGSKKILRVKKRQLGLFLLFMTVFVFGSTSLLGVMKFNEIIAWFTEHRETSASTRMAIYLSSIEHIFKSPFIGYGNPREIPGLKAIYALGTHSSLIGIAFHYGVIALLVYITYILSLWKRIMMNFKNINNQRGLLIYISACISLFGFNIRELADIWWWDTMLCFLYVVLVSFLHTPAITHQTAHQFTPPPSQSHPHQNID